MGSSADNLKEPPKELLSQPPEEYLGSHGSTSTWQNTRGLQIFSYFWPAEVAKGHVIICHSHGSYLCYDYLSKPQALGTGAWVYEGSWVEAFNRAGYSVSGIDAQGHGRSHGLRAYVNSFNDLEEDLLQHVRQSMSSGLDGFDASLPRFVMGVSMGGCLALTAALKAQEAQAQQLFSGVVLMAPMISLEKLSKKGLNPYMRPIGSLLSMLLPTLPAVSVNRNPRFPDLQESYDKDPGTYKSATRVRNGFEYLKATEWLCARLSKITFPFIVFHSEEDTQTDPEGSRKLWAEAQSTDKELRLLRDFWHILMKEPGNEALRDQVLAWLNDRVGRPVGTTAARSSGTLSGSAAPSGNAEPAQVA